MIKDLITNKNAKERVQIKSREIAKMDFSGLFQNAYYGIDTQIIGEVKEIQGGIEFFAKAWKNGKPLGFGKDGSVEIERFRIFNPPVLIESLDGDVIQELTEDITKRRIIRKLKENPIEAIKQTLAHIIKLVGKENSKIIKGKIGNTTSTFYPDADPESTSVDGSVRHALDNQTWATIQGGAGNTVVDTGTGEALGLIYSGSTSGWQQISRAIFLFDTSAIADNDIIDSATLSFYGNGKSDGLTISPTLNVYSSAPASNTALAAGDYDSLGTTAFSTNITNANFSTTAYNDFVLNASGLAAISKTSVSKFGTRESTYDALNVEPTRNGNSLLSHFNANCADQTGTANDPKLVVVHTAPITVKGEFFQLF